MNQLIQRLIAAASSRGLSETKPVLLTADGNGIRVNIYVGYSEPVEVRAPLNLIWIHPVTADALRRVSRESSGFEHTWSVLTPETFFVDQVWDEPRPADQDFQELNNNIGNPHGLVAHDIGAITFEGGQFTGAILVRELDAGETYSEGEAVPLSFIRILLSPIQSLASSTFQQLNALRNQIVALRTRITATEIRLDSVAGTQRYVYTQSHGEGEVGSGERDWLIVHNLNATVTDLTVTGDDGRLIIPDRIETVDANTLIVVFAELVSGTAVVTKVQ